MRTSIVRAVVVTLAVATFGLLSLSPMARAVVADDPQTGSGDPSGKFRQGYVDGYEKAYNETTRAMENQGQDEGSSGGSCG